MSGLFLAGRILFGGFFLLSGLNHFFGLGHMTEYAAAEGVPLPGVAVIVTGLLLVGGGLSMILGYLPRLGVLFLVLFLVPVAFWIHDFWTYADSGEARVQMLFFLRNLGMAGAALMMLAIPEPWPRSVGSGRRAGPGAGPAAGARPDQGAGTGAGPAAGPEGGEDPGVPRTP